MTLFDQNLTVARPIIRAITVDLVRFIQHFYQMEDLERRSLEKLQGEVNNYFVMIKSELQIVWNALGDHLTGDTELASESAAQVEAGADEGSSSVQMKAIDLIAFCLRDLHPNIAHYEDDRHDL